MILWIQPTPICIEKWLQKPLATWGGGRWQASLGIGVSGLLLQALILVYFLGVHTFASPPSVPPRQIPYFLVNLRHRGRLNPTLDLLQVTLSFP